MRIGAMHQEISLPSSGAAWRSRAAINVLLSLAACSLQGQIAQSVAHDLVTGSEAPPSPAAVSYSKRVPSDKASPDAKPDFNRDIYYRNKLEFSFESGWLPNNVPLIFDFIVGSPYTTWPLHYTLQPNIASLRWQLDGIEGPLILRGNWDFTFSGSATIIPRGPETRYFAFDYGIRRNFIPRNWRIVPYYEMRGGVGNINAKGPDGVEYAQGQDLTFTLMVGSGARYNFSPRTSVEVGVTYMHVSNAYLSQPKYEDFGINVYGPIVGINIRLGRPKPPVEQ
jgi:Lipid A 3-O-deacylase (PagL)